MATLFLYFNPLTFKISRNYSHKIIFPVHSNKTLKIYTPASGTWNPAKPPQRSMSRHKETVVTFVQYRPNPELECGLIWSHQPTIYSTDKTRTWYLGYLYRCRVSAFLHVCQFEPRLFLKSHFKTFDQIEPAIFLLSKSQAQPPIKILYLFCNYTHSLKNPIPCQSVFNPPLWDPLHNIHQSNKDMICLLLQLTWKEKIKQQFHQFITLPFWNLSR